MLLISLNDIHSTLYLQCNASMPDSIDNRTNKYQIPALPTAAPDHGSSKSFSANHPSLRRLRALRSHVGAFIVLCSHYVHSDHWPLIQCTAPWAHISDARSGRGQFSPRCPRLAHTDKCPSKAMYKTNSNATQGSEIFVCVNTFFRCTISVINVQYLWHRIVHVVSKVSLDTEVNIIQVILLHKESHLCHKHFNLLIIIIRIEHVFTIFTCWDNHNRAYKSFPYHQKSRPFCWVEIKLWFDQFSVVHRPCFQARSSRPNFGCQEHLSRQIQFGNKEMRKRKKCWWTKTHQYLVTL